MFSWKALSAVREKEWPGGTEGTERGMALVALTGRSFVLTPTASAFPGLLLGDGSGSDRHTPLTARSTNNPGVIA